MTRPWHHKPAAFVAALEQAHHDGQGLWTLSLIFPEEVPERFAQARRGDLGARLEIDAVIYALDQIRLVRRRRDGPQCALCERQFWRGGGPRALAIMRARVPDGLPPESGVIVNCICQGCVDRHPDRHALMMRLTDLYRENLLPNLRVLPPMAGEGHA